ncbi:hypothetical protein ABT263_29340 [Kitasatospora sp. NPDC001603]|uniref:hypothetical protein n=1 Tax=Kitasatospora sp. NPDC001603 TaxID=3154388 RepID=UPI003322AAA9
MPADPYRPLYEDSEIFALELVRRAADPAATARAEHAVRDLAQRHPALAEEAAAIGLTAALARLSCTVLHAASSRHDPLTAQTPEDRPAPTAAHAREIAGVLDRLGAGLRSTGAAPLDVAQRSFIELTRLALAEQMPGGRPLRKSATKPLGCALAAPEPVVALLPLVTCAAQLARACLHHLLGLDLPLAPDSDAGTARVVDPDRALRQVLDGFEMHKITQHAAVAGAL